MVNINPKMDAKIVVFRYPTLNCMAHATGTTIKDEIIRIPTVLADTEIVTAIRIIKIKFILSTLTPESLAEPLSYMNTEKFPLFHFPYLLIFYLIDLVYIILYLFKIMGYHKNCNVVFLINVTQKMKQGFL